MKKILAIFLCVQLLSIPAFAEYDFSDEAQAEFDRNRTLQFQPNDFTRTKTGREIKKTQPVEQIDEIYDRTNFLPVEINEDLLTPIQTPSQRQLFGSVVRIPAGTSFSVTFDSGISSGSLEKNDRLTVRLNEDLGYNGQIIAPAGSLVYGSAVSAQNAGYAYGSGEIDLSFNQILTPDGNMLNISTEKVHMKAKSTRATNMSRDILVGTLGSLLLGAAFTAMGGGNDWGRNMLIYGGIGAVGGGLHGAMQRGEEVQIPNGTTINVKLLNELSASPYSL